MILDYEEFANRWSRIINSLHIPMMWCYSCKRGITNPHLLFVYVEYNRGCPHCKGQLYLISSKHDT